MDPSCCLFPKRGSSAHIPSYVPAGTAISATIFHPWILLSHSIKISGKNLSLDNPNTFSDAGGACPHCRKHTRCETPFWHRPKPAPSVSSVVRWENGACRNPAPWVPAPHGFPQPPAAWKAERTCLCNLVLRQLQNRFFCTYHQNISLKIFNASEYIISIFH